MATNENASSPMQEQPPVYSYPDWASMQAYYGPGVHIPPFLNASIVRGHLPNPYMWSTQPMISPFGGPYGAMYQHGVSPHIASLVCQEIPAKSQRIRKKSKVPDRTSISIGNGSAESEAVNGDRMSHSGDDTEDGSTDGSEDNNESDGSKNQIKRNSADISKEISTPNISLGVELKASGSSKVKLSRALIPSSTAMEPCQNSDERELKREKRKQSNRESARRSRLRKQAEAEELAVKVGTLTAENTTLRSEISRLTESSAKLRSENSALMEKLKLVHSNQAEEIASEMIDKVEAPSIFTENLLSRIDSSSSNGGNKKMEDGPKDNSGGKLHELLDSKTRTDAVAAS